MAYAAESDLVAVGMPPQSLGQLSPDQINAALQNASDKLDEGFRGRYGDGPSPLLLTWDSSITEAVAQIAAYKLIKVRGYDPDSGADSTFRDGYMDAMQFIDRVQRQQAHPVVTVAGTPLAGAVQPNLISSSVINLANGRRAPQRGW
jgi:phage gp36-like protein